ncbi:hypothetical protein HZC27_02620 [Candidatus Roizmanbacteria bacterium]|nr:hypothetical protein [Candidatus Roizmanbacteria bacterium]
MILLKRILILEDNLLVLSKLLANFELLEQEQPYALSLVILTDYTQVEDYINNNPKANFDIIILDRDCKLNDSFHNLNFERFGSDKVISISAVPQHNEAAQKRGVTKIVQKDIRNYDEFAKKVVKVVEEMI